MPEESWHEARLIPTSGIGGAEEQERRATSALLAVMAAVKEFGRTITKRLGAPAGDLRTYTEVPFELNGRRVFPDGLLQVTRGQRTWTALVEVKTGTNVIESEQLETYLDVAREEGFDAVLTVSNEIPPVPGTHPTSVDRRKLRRVSLHHLSWTFVLTEAVMQKVHRGVSDPDQAWILGELIRYLEHPKSGALEFEDMGSAWPSVREAVRAGTLRASDKGALEVANRWDQLVRYVCLRLGRQLGVEVEPVLSRKELDDPGVRAQGLVTGLERDGCLDGGIRIPDTVSPITLSADLRAQLVTAAIDVAAPREGRPMTRVNWLLRQLKAAPGTIRIDAFAAHARGASTSELLSAAREESGRLVADPKRELRSFRVALSAPMGTKRGQGRGSFTGSVLDLVDAFYESVVQTVRPWAPAPPKLRPEKVVEREPGVERALMSTALSSQDEKSAAESLADDEPVGFESELEPDEQTDKEGVQRSPSGEEPPPQGFDSGPSV